MNKGRAHWTGGSATDRLFLLAVTIKGIDGALEMLGGLFIALVGARQLSDLGALLTAHELSRDPNDTIANLILDAFRALATGRRGFAATYLILHGLIKALLVIGLLRGKAWAYPVGAGFLGLFVLYTTYRLALVWSWPLAAFIAFDLLTIALILQEWRSHSRTVSA